MIPPTRYIDAGPGVALANPQASMVEAQAYARMGATIQHIGARGFEVAEKVRKQEEAGKLSAFFSNMDEQAAKFSTALMTRSDTGAWATDWKQQTTEMREGMRKLGISPEGMAKAEIEFGNWSTQRSIHFETQAATKALQMGRAQVSNSLGYYASRGDKESYVREVGRAKDAGMIDPVEEESAMREFDSIDARIAIEEEIKVDPGAVIVRAENGDLLKDYPGATLDMVKGAKRMAEAKKEDYRTEEMDDVETALLEGKPVDLEKTVWLTDRDRLEVKQAIAKAEPPTNVDHAAAWAFLDNLREARTDPAMTQEAYRNLWNETRGAVIGRIPPQWQGDLKKELNYLSPAGRGKNGGDAGQSAEDLEAIGRSAAFRARDAGLFGSVAEDAPYAVQEKAFRKAEDIRVQVKAYVKKNPEAGVDDVREFADKLISGDRSPNAAKKIPLPGAGATMRPLPGMGSGSGGSAPFLLPSKDELEDFIK